MLKCLSDNPVTSLMCQFEAVANDDTYMCRVSPFGRYANTKKQTETFEKAMRQHSANYKAE